MKLLPRGLLLFDASAYIRLIRFGALPEFFEDEDVFLRTTLVTENTRDFRRWQRLLRSAWPKPPVVRS